MLMLPSDQSAAFQSWYLLISELNIYFRVLLEIMCKKIIPDNRSEHLKMIYITIHMVFQQSLIPAQPQNSRDAFIYLMFEAFFEKLT